MTYTACAHCKKEFERVHKMIYCSKECCKKANKKPLVIRTKRICAYQPCSKEFVPKNNNGKYCSSTCCTYHSHGDTIIPGVRKRRSIEIQATRLPMSVIWVKECPIKKVLFIARNKGTKFHPSCTAMDHYFYYRIPKPKNVLTCAECDNTFESYRSTLTHCVECRKREDRRVRRSSRRAKIRGVIKERVFPYRVFVRDEWTCQCCGIPTPKNLRGTLEMNAPEMDHIIPLAKGGDHSYKNVQCLCRACNAIKGDKIEYKFIKRINTMPLIGARL